MTPRLWFAVAIVACACVAASCERADKAATDGSQSVPVAQSSSTLSGDELLVFDRVTTLETVIPEASLRDLYTENDAVTEDGQRSYTFALKSQPAMDPSRHFQLITVTWGRAGTLANDAGRNSGVSGTGGPSGGFVEKISTTFDHAYDVRIALGELLPNTVKAPRVDLDTLLQRLLNEYNDAKSR